MTPIDQAKLAAAARAARLVETGMKVGLGTGSTASLLVRCLGAMVRDGLRITAVPTSARTAQQARAEGIALVSLDEAGRLDLTIDGADEVDGALDLLKGGGGALLREKIVAAASDRYVVIADAAKRVDALGAFPLPVEVVPFGWRSTKALIEEALVGLDVLGRTAVLRMDGEAPFVTDEGHHILDLRLGRIGDARRLTVVLNQVPGVVENGLFVGICDTLVLGLGDGRVEVRDAGGTIEVSRAAVDDAGNIFTDSSE